MHVDGGHLSRERLTHMYKNLLRTLILEFTNKYYHKKINYMTEGQNGLVS